jgi:hypothetical protein
MNGPLNFVDPPRRDVVGVGGGEVIIRFKSDIHSPSGAFPDLLL